MTRHRILTSDRLKDLKLDDVVYAHLTYSPYTETKDYVVQSCLHEVEREMTQARGNVNTSQYAPLLCAFALINQVGGCYGKNSILAHPAQGGSFHRALYYFGGLAAMSDEVKALYALRNGVVHDGSLTCETNKDGWYMFRYDSTLPNPVQLAKRPWDGTAADLGPDTTTKINPRAVTDLTLQMLNNLRECFFDHRQSLDVLQSREDILHKYCFWRKR